MDKFKRVFSIVITYIYQVILVFIFYNTFIRLLPIKGNTFSYIEYFDEKKIIGVIILFLYALLSKINNFLLKRVKHHLIVYYWTKVSNAIISLILIISLAIVITTLIQLLLPVIGSLNDAFLLYPKK